MTVLQGLSRYFDRVVATGAVAPLGYSPERISFSIVLSPGGGIVDVVSEGDRSGRKPHPKMLVVPASFKRPGTASNPFFLWDKTSYVFGVVDTTKKTSAKDPMQDHRAFVEFHDRLLDGTNDEGLRAFLAFLRTWDPTRYDTLPHAAEMLDQNVVFRLDGELNYLHERPAAQAVWARHKGGAEGEAATCLVTGEFGPVARLHPAIKGVPGALTTGASLVSFNLNAFTSYGKEQGANAPVSERAAHAYGTALNALLAAHSGRDEKGRPQYTNRVQIGDATTVFWAEAPEAEAVEAERLVFSLLDPPSDQDEARRLSALLSQVAAGRPLAELNLGLDPATRFHILGLSPNGPRLSVRFYLSTDLGHLYANGQAHWRDLRLEPSNGAPFPALWRLLLETAVRGKSENVSPALAGELARAVFTGARYPRALLAQTLMRIRAEGLVRDNGGLNQLRVALVKAYLARSHRLGFDPENVPVALDPDEINVAYRLGRLFALLEGAQYAALGNVNASIRDKYFSAASATPARVFPLLLRGVQDHLGKVRSTGRGGLARWFDTAIADVMSGLSANSPFPPTLRLEDQGRFVVGYYHQRRRRAEPAEPNPTDEPIEV